MFQVKKVSKGEVLRSVDVTLVGQPAKVVQQVRSAGWIVTDEQGNYKDGVFSLKNAAEKQAAYMNAK